MASDDWLQKPQLDLHIIINLAHDLDPMDLPIQGEPRLSRYQRMRAAIADVKLIAVLRGDKPNIWSVVSIYFLWSFAFKHCANDGEWDWLRSFCKKWADARGETFPEVSAAEKRRATVGAEADCRQWLADLMREGSPQHPKAQYLENAKERFSIGVRGFDRAWATAIVVTGNTDWSRPGRKS